MASEPVQELPTVTPQELRAVNLYPHQRLIEIKTRGPLAIHDSQCVVSYDVIEGMFLTLLQIRMHERGQSVALQPMANGTPT